MAKARGRKQPSYSSLKTKLDKVFSEWVRRSNAFPAGDLAAGMVRCITCGIPHEWNRMQAGHFVSRVHLGTRWDERNVQPQCFSCNVWRRGSPAEFSVFLTTKYGPDILKELVNLKHQTYKFTRADLQEKIDSYKARLQALG